MTVLYQKKPVVNSVSVVKTNPVKKTKAEMAVDVANDVLKNLRYIRNIETGTYCEGSILDIGLDNPKGSVQPYINDLTKHCDVCALGACFLSYIRLHNKVTFEEIVDSYEGDYLSPGSTFIITKLKKVFSPEQIDLIECAFERSVFNRTVKNTFTTKRRDKAIEFGSRYLDDKERLRAIMKNIVKNNGKFVP